MKITEDKLKIWNELRSPADAGEMAKLPESYTAQTFTRALRLGKCNDKVYKILAEFYKEKAKNLKKYL